MKIGKKFNKTYKVSAKVYNGFKNLFKDNNPMHTNEDYAKKFGFYSQVMYGNILNGFISNFVGELLPVKNVVIVNQSINYLKPVYQNDQLKFVAIVINKSKAVSIVEFSILFENQKNEKIASGKVQIKILSENKSKASSN